MSSDVLDEFSRLRRALARAYGAAIAGSEVGPLQFSLLRELRRSGPGSQAALARVMVIDPAAMVRLVDALVARGWALRTASEEDRRQKLVSLTAGGRRMLKTLDDPFEAFEARIEGALTATERKAFKALVQKLVAALEASEPAAPAQGEAS
ncbi:MAG: MarR family transcriptional regulator [Deltaproteobacteria bacterium]|nr:MarR family transcriptional regulator [Deltaproteobacteria bacterium]